MRLLLPLALLLAACSSEAPRPFPVGVTGPLSPRLRAEVLRLGFDAAEIAPAFAAVERASDERDLTLPAARLRFVAARAAHDGAAGVYFTPPRLPEGVDWADYPEEWQAAVRVLRELATLRPILEHGRPAATPFAAEDGMRSRAWSRGGRVYILVLNPTGAPLPLDGEALSQYRALFRARTDARESLGPCGKGFCLPPEGVLWLEGRLLPGAGL